MASIAQLLAAILALCTLALGQQYQGSSYNNTFTNVGGSEITFFNIRDASGQNTSLLNYMISPNGERQDPTKVHKAVIVIHGLGQDPFTYMSNMLVALSKAQQQRPEVNPETIAIMAPSFSNGNQKNVAFPWVDGAKPAAAGSTSQALVWKGSQWASGLLNQYPYKQTTVSSYDVMDQILEYFGDASTYPNLKSIVVAGHSLGGQYVNRYSAVGNTPSISVPVRFWIGNPNDWLWFDTTRPATKTPAVDCPTYDDWRQGLASGTTPSYADALVGQGRAAVYSNYQSKSKILAKALGDSGDDSSSCAPFTVGQNRDERFFETIKAYPPTSIDNVDYVANVGHDAGAMFSSQAGLYRLFFDNFDGDGSRHADFGDRQQDGDSPNPDSANTKAFVIQASDYQGCWTDTADDATGHGLKYAVSVSNLTVESCTAACSSAGYSIAGLLAGSDCRCDNELSSSSVQVVEKACSSSCPGDDDEYCGGPSRLSLWSASAIEQRPTPQAVQSSGAFTLQGCYVDGVNGRTLNATATTSASMTVAFCANYCADYLYMGVEYNDECYCSNTFAGTVANATDCSYSCSGDNSQVCGGNARLSLYQQPQPQSQSTKDISSSKLSSNATYAGYSYYGCWQDNNNGRALPVEGYAGNNNTLENCAQTCSSLGYTFAGTEYSAECWCGNELQAASAQVDDSQCSMACSGDSTEMCGGPNLLSVLKRSSSQANANTTASATDQATAASTATADATPTATSTSLQQAPLYRGCWSDNTDGRALPSLAYANSSNTNEQCHTACRELGFGTSGTEYGQECWCGNALTYAARLQPDSDCSVTCAGNSSETCGGGNRLTVWSDETPVPQDVPPTIVQSSSGYTYFGCYVEQTPRVLVNAAGGGSVEKCIASCSSFGYDWAGMEYSTECYCDSAVSSSAQLAPDSECSMACSDDATEVCGGNSRIAVYQRSLDATSTTATASATISSSEIDSPSSTIPTSNDDAASTTATGTSSGSPSVAPTASSETFTSASNDAVPTAGSTLSDPSRGPLATPTNSDPSDTETSVAQATALVDATQVQSDSDTIASSTISANNNDATTTSASDNASTISAEAAVQTSPPTSVESSTSEATTSIDATKTSAATEATLTSSDDTTTAAASTAAVSTSDVVTSSESAQETGPSATLLDSPATTSAAETTMLSSSSSAAPSSSAPEKEESTSTSTSSLGDKDSTSTNAPSSAVTSTLASSVALSLGPQPTSTLVLSTVRATSSLGASTSSSVKASATTSKTSSSASSSSLPGSVSKTSSSAVPSSSSKTSSSAILTTPSLKPSTSSAASTTTQSKATASATVTTASSKSSSSTVLSTTSSKATSTASSATTSSKASLAASSVTSTSAEPSLLTTLSTHISTPSTSSASTSIKSTASSTSQKSSTSTSAVGMASSKTSTSTSAVGTASGKTSTSTSAVGTASGKMSTSAPTSSTSAKSSSVSSALSSKTTSATSTSVKPTTTSKLASSSSTLASSSSKATTSSTASSSNSKASSSFSSTPTTAKSLTTATMTTSKATSSSVSAKATTTSSSVSAKATSSSIAKATSSSSLSTSKPVTTSKATSLATTASSKPATSSTSKVTSLSQASSSSKTTSSRSSTVSSSSKTTTTAVTSSTTKTSTTSTSTAKVTSTLSTKASAAASSSTTKSSSSSSTTKSSTSSSSSSSTTRATSTSLRSTATSTTAASALKSSVTASSKATTVTSLATSATLVTSKVSSSSTRSSTTKAASFVRLSSRYTALGCYRDSASGRTLQDATYVKQTNTLQECTSFCSGMGYRYSGVESGTSCFCSDYILRQGATYGSGQSGCTTACAGGDGNTCGGTDRIQIYQDSQWTAQSQTVKTYGRWSFNDCFVDSTTSRTLKTKVTVDTDTMTVGKCLDACAAQNLKYCGVEDGGQCWGSTTLPSQSKSAPSLGDTDPIARGCSVSCNGDSKQVCGGSNRLDVYTYE